MTDAELMEAVWPIALRSNVRFLLGSPALAEVLRAAVDAAMAQPAQERKPLTDEQIKECIKRIDPDSSYMPKALKQLARAIEQAHGIGSKT